MQSIYLKAVNPDLNVAREYHIHMCEDLFASHICETAWGRMGAKKNRKIVSFKTKEELDLYVTATLKRRSTSVRRCGASYERVT